MKFVSAIAAAALVATVSTAAQAADLGVVVMDEPTTVMTDPGFDWNGFYAGISVGATNFVGPAAGSGTDGEALFVLGANGTVNSVLFGLEGWVGVHGGVNPTGVVGGADARIGFIATPDVAIYGLASGRAYSAGARYFGLGGGVEFALTDDVSFDARYTYYGWSNNAYVAHDVRGSLRYHF